MTTTHDTDHSLERFLSVWSDHYMLNDLAVHLTCTEAEALSDLFREHGHEKAAFVFMESHALGDDDPEDDHRLMTAAEVIAIIDATPALKAKVLAAVAEAMTTWENDMLPVPAGWVGGAVRNALPFEIDSRLCTDFVTTDPTGELGAHFYPEEDS